jgi:hypothetical protein
MTGKLINKWINYLRIKLFTKMLLNIYTINISIYPNQSQIKDITQSILKMPKLAIDHLMLF